MSKKQFLLLPTSVGSIERGIQERGERNILNDIYETIYRLDTDSALSAYPVRPELKKQIERHSAEDAVLIRELHHACRYQYGFFLYEAMKHIFSDKKAFKLEYTTAFAQIECLRHVIYILSSCAKRQQSSRGIKEEKFFLKEGLRISISLIDTAEQIIKRCDPFIISKTKLNMDISHPYTKEDAITGLVIFCEWLIKNQSLLTHEIAGLLYQMAFGLPINLTDYMEEYLETEKTEINLIDENCQAIVAKEQQEHNMIIQRIVTRLGAMHKKRSEAANFYLKKFHELMKGVSDPFFIDLLQHYCQLVEIYAQPFPKGKIDSLEPILRSRRAYDMVSIHFLPAQQTFWAFFWTIILYQIVISSVKQDQRYIFVCKEHEDALRVLIQSPGKIMRLVEEKSLRTACKQAAGCLQKVRMDGEILSCDPSGITGLSIFDAASMLAEKTSFAWGRKDRTGENIESWFNGMKCFSVPHYFMYVFQENDNANGISALSIPEIETLESENISDKTAEAHFQFEMDGIEESSEKNEKVKPLPPIFFCSDPWKLSWAELLQPLTGEADEETEDNLNECLQKNKVPRLVSAASILSVVRFIHDASLVGYEGLVHVKLKQTEEPWIKRRINKLRLLFRHEIDAEGIVQAIHIHLYMRKEWATGDFV